MMYFKQNMLVIESSKSKIKAFERMVIETECFHNMNKKIDRSRLD